MSNKTKLKIPNYKKILSQAEKWRVDAYRFTVKGDRIWVEMDRRTQRTIPEDTSLLEKLGIKESETVLFIAGYYGTWANAVANAGIKTTYSEISEELLSFAKEKFSSNKNIIDYKCSDFASIPDKPQEYDWTLSFEPIAAESGLLIAALRALVNKRGIKIIHYPRPIVPAEKFLNLKTISDTYGCQFDRKQVYIEGSSNHFKPLEKLHTITTITTNAVARKWAETDIKALEADTFSNESLTRLSKIAIIFDDKFIISK